MKKNRTNYFILILFSFFLITVLNSCGNRRHEKKEDRVKLKKKNDKELKAALFAQDSIPFHFFNVRVGVDYRTNNQNGSFSCYLKLNVDTAFGGTFKKGPIVVATFKVTSDSIVYVNKLEKCYFAENLDFVSSLFGTDIEYEFFQDLLLGLPIGIEEDIKYKQIKSKTHYILSSHKKNDFKKLENDRLNVTKNAVLIQYHLDAQTLQVNKINIDTPADTTSIEIIFLERKIESGYTVPEQTTITIVNPNDSISIHFNYGNVKFNEPKKIRAKIPSSYIECP